MEKSDLKLLERIFAAEINNALPYQGKPKRYRELEEEGYVEHVTVTLPGRFPVQISGWVLTHKGRYAYCNECGKVEGR